MKELEEKDFDKIFRSRMNNEFLDFEEESWLKMEKKLRKRDRVIFLRYASIILLLLSFGITTYYWSKKPLVETINTKNKIKPQDRNHLNREQNMREVDQFNYRQSKSKTTSINQSYTSKIFHQSKNNISSSIASATINLKPEISIDENKYKDQTIIAAHKNQVIPNTNQSVADSALSDEKTSLTAKIKDQPKTNNAEETLKKSKFKLPVTLAIIAGPDFSSTSAVIGGKSGVFVGVNIGVQLSKKLAVQSGLAYGSKNYDARSFDYSFNNPNTQNIISNIKAVCRVLEIPLRASYLITDNARSNIAVNAGLSSYIMLNEKYTFKYTPTSGRNDRMTNIDNANQHLLSVLDISATYNIKLENKRFTVGIEPYVKIPLTGIGEGNVPLKSSGVSLKLNYDFSKN